MRSNKFGGRATYNVHAIQPMWFNKKKNEPNPNGGKFMTEKRTLLPMVCNLPQSTTSHEIIPNGCQKWYFSVSGDVTNFYEEDKTTFSTVAINFENANRKFQNYSRSLDTGND